MSILDDFMSQVIDLDEKEKEETILFLAKALLCEKDNEFIKKVSPKVLLVILPFLADVAINIIKKKGGEKVENIGAGKESKKV